MRGRPPLKYDPVLGTEICDLLACSDRSLTEVLDSLGNPISESTFYKWIRENDEFAQESARARESQGHYLADKALVESRTIRSGKVTKNSDKDGRSVTEGDNVERSKLIVQTYLKRAGQLNKALGDRTTLAGDPDNPLMGQMDDAERSRRIAAILAAAKERRDKDGE